MRRVAGRCLHRQECHQRTVYTPKAGYSVMSILLYEWRWRAREEGL
jgi:hypothetical protein